MSYVYDSFRRLQSETRTFTGLGSNNYTFNYTYNLGGQLKQANYVAPSFNKNVSYAYNTTGALSGIGTNLWGSDPNATTNVISTMSYQAFGAASSISYGNNRKATLSYNPDLMRLGQMVVARPDGSDKLVDNVYNYLENGLLWSIWNYVDSTYMAEYEYNFRNQLSKWYRNGTATTYGVGSWGEYGGSWEHPSNLTITFNYPKLSGTQVPATNRASSMVVNYGGTTNFSYDNAGNMTAANSTTYQWDAANRLKSVNNGSLGSYGYDGNGKRVKKTESGVTTYYVISSVVGAAMEVTSAGVQRAYVMSGGSIVAQLNPNGQFYWLHLDHLGSGRKMTDSSGNMTYRAEFDPYGKLLYEWSSPANLNTKKFTGYERDATTNLDYAQARMYSSDWGRFLSPDPLGLGAARLNSPKSLNRYAYVEGNPVNYNDPSGLFLPAPTPVVLCGLTPTIWCPGGSPANIQQPPTTLPVQIPHVPNWPGVLPPQPTVPPPPPSPLNALQRQAVENGIASARDLLRNDACLRFVSNVIQEAARLQGIGVPADGIDPQTGAILYSAVYDALQAFTNQLNAGNISATNAPGGNTIMTTNDGTPQGALKVRVNNEYFNLSVQQQGQHTLHEALHQLGITDIYMASAIGVYQQGDDNPTASRRFNERFFQVCR